MRALSAALLFLLAALLGPAPARAAKVVAVLSADHGIYRKALGGFEAAFGSTVAVRLASGDSLLDADTRVVVAIGGRAALRSYPAGVSVVYCLAPPVYLDGARGPAVHVRRVPSPASLLERIQAAQPRARVLAVLWSQPSFHDYVRELAAHGKRSGLAVLSLPADASDLPRLLRLIEGRAQAVWLAPDPQLVTPANFKLIRDFADRGKFAFYAPTAELVQEGATASVSVAPEEMGRSAAAAAQRLLAGEAGPPEVYADRLQVVVDPARAATAGLTLSTDVVKISPAPPR